MTTTIERTRTSQLRHYFEDLKADLLADHDCLECVETFVWELESDLENALPTWITEEMDAREVDRVIQDTLFELNITARIYHYFN